jgi:hypothetical protein
MGDGWVSAFSIPKICFRLTVRAAVRRRCCAMGDLRSDDLPSLLQPARRGINVLTWLPSRGICGMDAFLSLMIRVDLQLSRIRGDASREARPLGGGPFGLPVTMEDMTWQNRKTA